MSFGTAFALPSTAWQRGGGGPTYSLNFLTGTLPAGVTYTRAGSTGTYIGSNGFVQNAVADTARFDYSPSSYIYQNLTIQSTAPQFWNAVGGVNVTVNNTIAPDGTNTGALITSAGAGGARFLQINSNTAIYCRTISAAIYLKPTSINRGAVVQIYDTVNDGPIASLTIASLTAGGTDAGNGWRRYTLSGIYNSTGVNIVNLRIYVDNTNGGQGPPVSSIYVWGPQINSTTVPTPYYPTTATEYIQANINGLLIEETRTNVIVQSSNYLDASWNVTTNLMTCFGGTTRAPDGTLTGQGMYAAAGDGNPHPHYFLPTTLPLTPTVSSPYTMSMYFLFFNNDTANFSNATWMQMVFTSGGFGATAYVNFNIDTGVMGTVGASIISSSITDVGYGWYRVTATANATAAVASGVQICYITSSSSPVAETNSVQLGSERSFVAWGCQLEAGNVATSYIPTTTAAVTRNADSAVLTTLTPWYNTTEGTLYTAFSVKGYNVGVFNAAAGFSDNTTTNFITNRVNPATQGNYIVRTAGVDQANVVSSGTTTANTTIKIASAYKANDFAMSLNGGTVVTDTSGTVPTVSRLVLGATGTVGTNPLNGWLATVNYYNTRSSNGTLVSIST
jgi:hypothetical protein